MDAGNIYEGEVAAMQGISEHHSFKHHVRNNYKKLLSFRSFAGINTFLIGDFYQLPPVGGTPIMGNPYSNSVLQNESVRNIMSRIWHCADEGAHPNAVQIWSEILGNTSCRVLDFQVNQRSGGDAWFVDVLSSCREGRMKDEDYRFLHGLPTLHCGSWLSRKEKSSCGQSNCAIFQETTKEMSFRSPTDWFAEMRA